MPNALPITQAGIVALLTTVVGFVVAFVPSLKTYEAAIISIGGAVIGVAFLVVNEIRAHTELKARIAGVGK